MSIGGAVFFTGLLAMVSSGFAIYSIFQSYWAASALGLVWGLMIFNLDRFLVASLKKRDKAWQEWVMALPRLALAVLIAVVIAKPLELRIFLPEIAAELNLIKEEQQATEEALARARYAPALAQYQAEAQQLEAQIADKTATRDALMEAARQEADGTGGSRRQNLGPIYMVKKADADRANRELDSLVRRNAALGYSLQAKIDSVQQRLGSDLLQIDVSQMGGLALQMEALGRLAEKHSAIAVANIFILLLFIAIETSPVLVKVLSPRGPYDDLLQAHEHGYTTFRKGKIHRLDVELDNELAWRG